MDYSNYFSENVKPRPCRQAVSTEKLPDTAHVVCSRLLSLSVQSIKTVILEESCPPLLLQDSEESGGGGIKDLPLLQILRPPIGIRELSGDSRMTVSSLA